MAIRLPLIFLVFIVTAGCQTYFPWSQEEYSAGLKGTEPPPPFSTNTTILHPGDNFGSWSVGKP
jgi:hypothetical protein